MTNRDVLKEGTAYEISAAILQAAWCQSPYGEKYCTYTCGKCIRNWLKEEYHAPHKAKRA